MDEFKMKLPLDLRPGRRDGRSGGTLSLLFTVYNVRFQSKGAWNHAKKFFGSIKAMDSAATVEHDLFMGTRLEQIACGFLPVTSQASLIENGVHDVRVVYTVRTPPRDLVDRGVVEASSLVLVERSETGEMIGGSLVDDSFAEQETIASLDSVVSNQGGSLEAKLDGGTTSSDITLDSRSGRKGPLLSEPISLSVSVQLEPRYRSVQFSHCFSRPYDHDSP